MASGHENLLGFLGIRVIKCWSDKSKNSAELKYRMRYWGRNERLKTDEALRGAFFFSPPCETTTRISIKIGECSKTDHKVIQKTIVCLRWGVEECGEIVFQSSVQSTCPHMHWISERAEINAKGKVVFPVMVSEVVQKFSFHDATLKGAHKRIK